MREILFRGKRIDNGEWIEGYYFERKDTRGNIIESVILVDAYEQITSGQRYVRSNLNHECFRVDFITIGQFIGVTDRNGKKIFEGDIIRSDNGKQSAVSVVKYGDFKPNMIYHMFRDCIGLEPRQSMHGAYCETKKEQMALFNSPTCIEVIGNIHDNPELMEE